MGAFLAYQGQRGTGSVRVARPREAARGINGMSGRDERALLQTAMEQSKRQHLVSSLPREKYCAQQHKDLTECELCLVDYEEGDELLRLPCMHIFHRSCVDPWLLKAATCPVCQVNACEAAGL